ncbi:MULTISPECIES: hypothetical protein [unclassified Microcoleus]|nr:MULTISPECIES: hypothetical protein [unclassified Microcoleus]
MRKIFWRGVDLSDRPSTYLHRQTTEVNQDPNLISIPVVSE